jgi:ADP-heptose:LPS heptosyltransferase
LLALLPQRPWRVLAGNLNLVQLAAVIQHSRLHFCGDTGPFHLAVMTRTPTVAWWWPNPGIRQWLPEGKEFRVLVGRNEPGTRFLSGITTTDLIAGAGELILGSQFGRLNQCFSRGS